MRRSLVASLALLLTVTTLFAAPAAVASGEPADGSGPILAQYLEAARKSQENLHGMTMTVEMHGSIPKLDRAGSMKAIRNVSPTGEVSYVGGSMTFEGSDTIKRDVIARYLQAEVEASKGTSLGITPANYKFKFFGLFGTGNWQLFLFEVTPRKKAPGLFEGWIWIDAKTGMPVREQGRFVKNPSVFLKRVDFVRDYDVSSGMAQPSNVTSTILTRIVGEAKLTIHYDGYERKSPTSVASAQ